MSEKAKKKLPVRLENTIKGIFMMLSSLILALTVGKIAHTFIFVPLYFVGGFVYILLGMVFLFGLYRLIFGHKLKIDSLLIKIGVISLIVASYFLILYITNNNQGLDFANDLQADIDLYNSKLTGYYDTVIIRPLAGDSFWGAGLIGILFNALIRNNAIVLGVSIIFIVLGLAFILVKPIYLLVEKARGYQPKAPKKKSPKVKKEPQEKKVPFFKKNKKDEYDEYDENPYPEITPISIEKEEENEFHAQFGFEKENEQQSYGTDFEQNNLSLDDNSYRSNKNEEYGEFSILKFDNGSNSGSYTRNDYMPETDSTQKEETSSYEEPSKANTYEEPIEETPVEEAPSTIEDIYEEPIETSQETSNASSSSNSFYDFHDVSEDDKYISEDSSKEEIIEESIDDFEDNFTPDFAPRNEYVAPQVEEKPIEKPISEKSAQQAQNNPQPQPQPVEEAPKKKERVEWIPPSSELLEVYETAAATELNTKVAEERMVLINTILGNFKVGARCTSYTIGSSVTRFNIEYDANVSVKSVDKLVDDISLRLGGVSARFTPIVANSPYSGLEIPNPTITTVSFKEVFESLPSTEKHLLSVGFGKDISGNVVAADFDEFPHLLVAGTTGSGKSIYIHSIIATLIMRVSPDDLKIVLVDPKKVEMTKYRDMPHLLCPIITESSKAKVMMSKLVDEMNDRYERFTLAESCSNIKQFNEYAREHDLETMPYIIVFLDEYADLVDTCKEISQPVVSIAQKARAAGIHMLISTQRPSTNVITGVIKGNLPTHVALMTSSYTDSMTIIGEGGAEKLLGKGDMLVQSPLVSRVGVTRLQGCFVQNKEIGRIVGYLKEHYKTEYDPNYMDLIDHSKEEAENMIASGEVEAEVNSADEEKYQSIKEWVMTQQYVSMSKIQRECGVGFNRAGKIFSRLQREGIVSTQQDGATKGCKVLKHGDDDSYDDLIVTSDEVIS